MLATQRQPSDSMATHRYTSSLPYGFSSAYPIPAPRRFAGRTTETAVEGLSYAEHEMLRSRKTPHGRIAEQCEVTSLDPTIYVPASKHVLLSRSPYSLNAYPSRPSIQYEATSHGQESQDLASFANRYPYGRAINTQQVDNTTRSTWDFVGGVDSALQQTVVLNDHKYYYHPGSQIPTVLPSALHTHFGPTASAAQQYYGPYWPDGTFSPYRPAPIRDSRFFGHEPGFSLSQAVSDPDARTLRRFGKLANIRGAGPLLENYRTSQQPVTREYLPFYDRVFNPTGEEEVLRRSHLNDTNYNIPGQQGYRTDILADRPFYYAIQHSQLEPGESSDRVAFRDRTFAWAHHVYVELLTKIQRENKLGRPVPGSSNSHKSTSKPVIFPKPPQRSGSCFKETFTLSQKSFDARCGSGNKAWSHEHNFDESGSQIATHSPQRKAAERVDFSKVDDTFPGLNHDQQPHQKYNNFRRRSDPSAYQLQQYQQPPSPASSALSALDTMELLCEEADVPWTDGMLLAGCLAYGLGNFSKALDWYQKILAQDSSHVEAMSNLAATLLALGRRDEALQNWSTAVRLRPSYFEAVEHLIGLLCTANRARHAVEIIEYVESCLKIPLAGDGQLNYDATSDGESDTQSQSSSITTTTSHERGVFDYDLERRTSGSSNQSIQQVAGYGSSGYAIPGCDNGRLLALIHAKGNMLYSLGENSGAAASFEKAILIATGHRHGGIRGLIRHILNSCIARVDQYSPTVLDHDSKEPILLSPERAQQTVQRMFPPTGQLPGLEFVAKGLAHKAAISTTSNSLLSLAKIYQDGLGNTLASTSRPTTNGTREILALYYLSLSLQRSPSTANNVGILLASVQQTTNIHVVPQCSNNQIINYAGIAPGSGIALALQYYNYGLNIDPKHAHLYTNLGSLLKDLGQLNSAIRMYEIAVQCDGNFDIALANLANAVKDQGKIAEAITYYRRAVQANPDFAEAVCGLATALNSVCNWYGRGGVYAEGGFRDRIHVDENGKMQDARKGCGWMNRVVEIVDKQLKDGENWGWGTLTPTVIEHICQQLSITTIQSSREEQQKFHQRLLKALQNWSCKKWEGVRVVRLIERAIRQIGWQWYQDRYKLGKEYPSKTYARPLLPTSLCSPTAPTVLPFHTFTTPLSAKQVRQISQRNALRISVAALRSPWLPATVYPPPKPPSPCLHVGYLSSDFNNHPLAHLMQSIFGLHDITRVKAFCYATTASDGSIHRQQIEREAPVFRDLSACSVEKTVAQIVNDGIHILVNLNGYTRGAKNEVFAARPAPIHMSFMGFAGTLGAEWCDYVFADSISVLPSTLAPWRSNVTIDDRLHPEASVEDEEDWMYAENVIFAKSTFFCVDHKQSAPDAHAGPPSLHDRTSRDLAWKAEQDRRWRLRKELFPTLSESAIIFGNFNQLYKIDPATFRIYLRILAGVPNAILWLLRFPDVGEQNLKNFAREWAGDDVAGRIIFTDVAPKGTHITRASVVDLFLDTPECNAHTTAADVIWSGTPIVTWARWDFKMCSRMASSILASALPEGQAGDEARSELLVESDEQYEKQAISLASGLRYPGANGALGRGRGRLMDLRRMLWEGRWSSRLFDTKRWVKDLETAYWKAWRKWESGEGGDIWL